MAEIPIQYLERLSRMGMTTYDWRVLMLILARTLGRRKQAEEIPLDDFFRVTKIKKPHICRSLSSLEDRNIIGKVVYQNKAYYYLQNNLKKWRSFPDIKASEEAIETWEERFERWWRRYPMKIYEEDTKNMYISLLDSREASPEELDDALIGYISLRKEQARRMNREDDPLTAMYPTTFLKDGKWKEFIQFTKLGEPRW